MVMARTTSQQSTTTTVAAREAEYRAFTNFIGGLVRSGLLSERDASLQLVEGFWENERRKAEDAGIDLDAQVREYAARKQGAAV